jgi:hypothetical protein
VAGGGAPPPLLLLLLLLLQLSPTGGRRCCSTVPGLGLVSDSSGGGVVRKGQVRVERGARLVDAPQVFQVRVAVGDGQLRFPLEELAQVVGERLWWIWFGMVLV